MPKVLLLTSPKNPLSTTTNYPEKFREKMASGTFEFFMSALDKLTFSIQSTKTYIHDTQNNLDIAEYDLICLRNVQLCPDYFKAVALYATHHKTALLDTADTQGTCFGKISQMMLFTLNGVAVPDTLSILDNQRFKQELMNQAIFPLIVKANDGIKGQNNFLVDNQHELETVFDTYPDKWFIAQPYVPNDGDFRLLYLGSHEPPTIFKRKAAEGSHLNNTSQGGQIETVNVHEFDAKALALSNRTMALMQRQIGGVDLLQHKDIGAWMALEVNTTPALATGVLLDKKAERFQALISSIIRKEKL